MSGRAGDPTERIHMTLPRSLRERLEGTLPDRDRADKLREAIEQWLDWAEAGEFRRMKKK